MEGGDQNGDPLLSTAQRRFAASVCSYVCISLISAICKISLISAVCRINCRVSAYQIQNEFIQKKKKKE